MLDMFKDGEIVNPVNDFIWSLPKDRCDDKVLDWNVKNLNASFYKLYGCTINIAEVQNAYLEKKTERALDLPTFCISSIEYFYMKANTIYELCYQIYERLCRPQRGGKKHEHLNEVLAKYEQATGRHVQFDWVEPINTIRNRIAHGGLSIKGFTTGSHLAFQAYDSEVDEQITRDHGFLVGDGPLVRADLYTAYYTVHIHRFIHQFLGFVVHCLDGEPTDEATLGTVERQQKQAGATLCLGFEETFMATWGQLKLHAR